MSILRTTWRSLFALAALAPISGGAMAAGQFDAGIPAGWTCLVGPCNDPTNTTVGTSATVTGTSVVTLPPSGSSYGWVSTYGGLDGASPFPNASVPSGGTGVGNTNGSWLRSNSFAATAGQHLNFQFNYVTSDGGTYADYAWARLLNAGSLTEADVIFTARTTGTTGVDPVPGFGLPTFGSTTLSVAGVTVLSVPLNATGYGPPSPGPEWSPLGPTYNGTCWNPGCGYTDWVDASYTVASSGSYVLEFGVTNWDDNAWDSGMAFNAATIAGVPIDDIPEPETYALMLAGLGLLGFMARRRRITA